MEILDLISIMKINKSNKILELLIYGCIYLIFILLFIILAYVENGLSNLIINIIFSFALIIIGFIYKVYPPSFIKSTVFVNSGYKSIRARTDEEHWKKAQELFSEYNIKLGRIYLLLDLLLIILYFFKLNLLNHTILLKLLIWGVGSLFYVESKLKKYFNEK